ncbi:MAG TPA: AbrB/MazE/SpoVT family DNA-binding domain-containing protein [Vitreimonas sp.]|uniref:AbrB/MazE/SpoVT family DNA-binding domain-containing protein n=1 Tax=Vitreimonas sp. TaxID=3069702 RepID=UPI002D6C1070|nr:AbrB/MazE/SpoVT family DNA-binding domain-containing protein [Vitreimonas sp.]HYD88252.1 AbrB/MazE/SpoVT family DNA-binding domain-containing protein [Vitreimonas sp.]
MSSVTVKGQVTIPKPVRDRLGVKPGDEVKFELTPEGRVVISKQRGKPGRSRFAALRGRAGKGLSTDQILALTRGE